MYKRQVDFISEKEDRIQQIEDRQKEIYRESSSRKRSIKNEEQYREYQIWHMEVQEELDELKQEKRNVKRQIQLAAVSYTHLDVYKRQVDYVNVGNKENLVTEAENQCEKVSHAALYARLSYESEKNRERNTIETQMVLLHNFVKEQKDIVVAKEYYDISKTGTNFERDGFNEMMQDIKEGNIDCVIVKDLSRLGRNYVEAGSYIERVFPFLSLIHISSH